LRQTKTNLVGIVLGREDVIQSPLQGERCAKPVRTGDRDNQDAAGQPPDTDNVIRLPTEWIGPREELVPIAPPGQSWVDVSPDEKPPPSADDFWGEDSADLHHAVGAPVLPPSVNRAGGRRVAAGARLSSGDLLRNPRSRIAVATAAVLVVLALIGYSQRSAAVHRSQAPATEEARLASAPPKPTPRAEEERIARARMLAGGQTVRTRPRSHRSAVRRPHPPRHRPARLHTEAPAVVETVTVAASTPAEPANSTPSTSAAPTSAWSSSGVQSASPSTADPTTSAGSSTGSSSTATGTEGGPAGPTGIPVVQGCDPKCP
jgi:hypothetical protein